jgi:glycosyltransferase involved in cell wall biosynthesis
MTDSPLITCIVPVHNGERYLAETLESILAQEHEPIELIVVDDASTDGSPELAESYGPPVRVIQLESQLGPAGARNQGLREARGDYLTFLDADDLYRPRKLTKQLRVLEEHPDVDVCLCVGLNFWEPGLEEERDRYVAAGRLRMTHHLSTLLASRSVFDRVGLLNERTTGDAADWFLRATDLNLTIRLVDEVLLDRRMHPESLSHHSPVMDDYFELVRSRIERLRR